MIMQTLNLVYSKDTSQTSVKTKPSPITLAAKQGTSNNLAHTTPPPYSTPPDRMNTNNLWYGGYQRTIFDSDNPLVAISYLGASNCRKGSEHGMESLERTFIWKCNAYSILLTKQINFTQKQWDGCFQSKIKIKILGFEKHQIKLKNTITTCKHQGGGVTQVYYWQGGTKAFLSDYCVYGDLSSNTHLTIIYNCIFFPFSVFLCGPLNYSTRPPGFVQSKHIAIWW